MCWRKAAPLPQHQTFVTEPNHSPQAWNGLRMNPTMPTLPHKPAVTRHCSPCIHITTNLTSPLSSPLLLCILLQFFCLTRNSALTHNGHCANHAKQTQPSV